MQFFENRSTSSKISFHGFHSKFFQVFSLTLEFLSDLVPESFLKISWGVLIFHRTNGPFFSSLIYRFGNANEVRPKKSAVMRWNHEPESIFFPKSVRDTSDLSHARSSNCNSHSSAVWDTNGSWILSTHLFIGRLSMCASFWGQPKYQFDKVPASAFLFDRHASLKMQEVCSITAIATMVDCKH